MSNSVTELAPPATEPVSRDPYFDSFETLPRFTVEEFAAEAARLYPVLPLYRLNGDLRVAVPADTRRYRYVARHRVAQR